MMSMNQLPFWHEVPCHHFLNDFQVAVAQRHQPVNGMLDQLRAPPTGNQPGTPNPKPRVHPKLGLRYALRTCDYDEDQQLQGAQSATCLPQAPSIPSTVWPERVALKRTTGRFTPDELKLAAQQRVLVMKPDALNVGHKCNLNISSMALVRTGYVNSFVTSKYPTQCHSPSTWLPWASTVFTLTLKY